MISLRRLGLLVLLVLTVLIVGLAFVIALSYFNTPRTITRLEPNYPCGLSFHSDTSRYIYRQKFLTWTPDGTQFLFNIDRKNIYIVDAAGSRLRNVVTISQFNFPSYGIHADVSPDGAQVVYTSCEFATGTEYRYSEQELYHYEIAIMNLDGTGKQRLTENYGLDHYPVWSPDGKQIAFLSTLHRMSSDRHYFPANIQLYAMAADGSDVRRLAKPEHRGAAPLPPVWSPDGRFLAFVKTDEPRGIYTARPDGTDLQQVLQLIRPTIHVSWSPDGSAFYVITDELELNVIEADGRGLRQVSLGSSSGDPGETRVAWSPDGKRIAINIPGHWAKWLHCAISTLHGGPRRHRQTGPDKCGQQ